ncbi:MAG: phosphoribosylanthranilate isomerase [Ignavibacteriaceae bacterium]|nr:phosphoribosylanthranilate isomerase [Ignavibacteriaceae bacterium]
MKTKVKICCISSIEEAQTAIKFGASALGLVAKMPSGPGVISDEEIRKIANSIPPPIASFLLTSETDTRQITQHQKSVGTNTIQIVDELKSGSYEEISLALPGIKIVQVIHVNGNESIELAISISKHVDAILLDSGNPNLQIKELGGTGRQHDWNISKKIRDSVSIPIFLAGGLNAENVKQAIQTVKPFGVDVCSGVRTNGKLDPIKLERFFHAVHSSN